MHALSRAALLAAAALTLAACSASATPESPAASATTAAESATEATSITLTDTWVKAADSGMTAAFGVIENASDTDVTIVAATSDATSEIQLHEVVDSMMSEVDGGFVVPAGGSLTLEPGGYHLMFMDVPTAIVPGDEVAITLEFSDGSTLEFSAVAKEFTGANEDYDDGMDDMDMGTESADMDS